MMKTRFRRAVIKVGSNVLTGKDGMLDETVMSGIADQTASLRKAGMEVILVSSGAVASGKSIVKCDRKLDPVSSRQLYSSVGQARLINIYCRLFDSHGIVCGQVLTTKESLSTRDHYLNQQNCMNVMLENGVIPVINENDTISVTELMFTDNDELSGMVASMMDADCLVILSNVDGIYDGRPSDPGVSVIREIRKGDDVAGFIGTEKSSFGRGGMLTKYRIASKVADEGIEVVIANGKKPGILTDILLESGRRLSGQGATPLYFSLDGHAAGVAGALAALTGEKASSLLPVGVTAVDGDFEKGDIVRIIAPDGTAAGIGKVSADSVRARESIGLKGRRPLIHYDYLYID